MLHAERNSSKITLAKEVKFLVLCMKRTPTGNLRWTLDSSSPLSDVGNCDWKASMNWDFAKERFHGCHFGYGGVRESANVVFNFGEVAGQVGISHRDHRSLRCCVVEQL